METKSNLIIVQGLPIVVANFNWSVGFQMERFLKALANKKILAGKCPGCGYVYFPPRNRCGKCYSKIEEKDLIELSGRAKLISWTIAYVELDGKGNWLDLKEPKIIGALQLEGADSIIFMPLGEISPAELKTGLALEPVWNSELKAGWKDIKYYKPASA